MQSKQYFTKIKNYPHEKSTEPKYLTELILVLNHKIWQYYETKPEFATLYNTLWEQAGQYAVENLKDDELSYYYEVTD